MATIRTHDGETADRRERSPGRSRRGRAVAASVAAIALIGGGILAFGAPAEAADPAHASSDGLASTPPMGFNDWNAYKCDVSAALIEQTARFMVTSGMRAAGYRYVNIDDCWLSKTRAADGSLVPDPTKFPDGIRAVAAVVHRLGLKLGIYEDAGTTTCAGYPGSLGHEEQDARTFASWDVDYLKYDQCNIPFGDYPGLTHQQIDTRLYSTMSAALRATGRPIVFSMCNGTDAAAHPWLWGAPVSNLWRTTTDIQDAFSSMVGIVQENAPLAPFAHPGAWNDPDMLEVGNGGMTDTEYRSEFSLWSEMAAPLIAGTTLTTASPQTLAIYENRDVIAVDQDRLGEQGRLLADHGGVMTFAKPLANGDVAVALFNATPQARTVATTAHAAGLRASRGYALRDLWSKRTTETAARIAAFVPAHGTVLYRVSVAHDRQALLHDAPQVVAAVTSTRDPVRTGQRSTVSVRVVDDALAPIAVRTPRLAGPRGWSVRALDGRARGRVLGTGRGLVVRFVVTAPRGAPPLSTADLVGLVRWSGARGGGSADPVLAVQLVSPVRSPYRTADTTAERVVIGRSGDDFAVDAAGTGVNPTTTTTRGTTPASDQYGAVSVRGAADGTATVEAVVTAQAPGRAAKAGLLLRDDMQAPTGSPEGVALFVTGSGAVGMAWDAAGGPVVDTASVLSTVQTLPVHLRLVRAGSTVTGSFSIDGTTWTQVGVAQVATAASSSRWDAGLFHTSGTPGFPTEADFSGFRITA